MAIEPVTREERFLAAAGGRSVTPPTPITRKEQLLQGIIDAVKSGGATPDVIEGAVNDYLNANPVQPGATDEQAAQIEQNKTDIADLQEEIENKQPKGDYVKTVNGKKPDASGNVVVDTGGNGSGENVSHAADIGFKAIAHRGWHDMAAQNTIAAFEAAAGQGFRWLEIDIRRCSDGIYVMAHDASVTLYDNGTAKSVVIGSSAYADIKGYTWDAAGVYKLCTLQAVFGAMKRHDMYMICDRKSGSNAEIMELAALCGAVDRVLLSYGSFSAAYNERTLLNRYRNVPIRCIPSDPANYVKLVEAISNPVFADVNASQTAHYQQYLNRALSCGVPILFSGCELGNKARWQVVAAGAMANNALNISVAEFVDAVSHNYDTVCNITPSTDAVAVAIGKTAAITAQSDLDDVSGYVYAYSTDPSVVDVKQSAFGPAAEITITAVTIGNAGIVFFCGNGARRTISVAVTDGASYSITNNLPNATTSNTAVSVAEGASYAANITANAGYVLDSVTVTMGGVDITADVYRNGAINIPSATGNIVITAVTSGNGVTVYSVTNNLSGATTSNTAATAEENSTYTATITAKSGYTLDGAEVSITMGGVDITEPAYSSGKIAISAVTGDIVISVAAPGKMGPVEVGYSIGTTVNNYEVQAYANRMMTVVNVGKYPFTVRADTSIPDERYPIPIPAGATTVSVVCPGTIPGIQVYTDGVRIADPGWQTADSTTYDLTQHEGATDIHINYKLPTGGDFPEDFDTSGFSIVFE